MLGNEANAVKLSVGDSAVIAAARWEIGAVGFGSKQQSNKLCRLAVGLLCFFFI